jgi:hypothetical protein
MPGLASGASCFRRSWPCFRWIIRLADPSKVDGPLGGAGKIVEADETELTRSRKTKRPASGTSPGLSTSRCLWIACEGIVAKVETQLLAKDPL